MRVSPVSDSEHTDPFWTSGSGHGPVEHLVAGALAAVGEDVDVAVEIVFETHSWSTDNDRGVATGWLPGELSERGRALARELGERSRDDGLSAVFTSDLRRAVETVELALAGSGLPVFADWRLRECDYGQLNGAPAAQVHADRRRYLTNPFPGGESWEQAIVRAGGFLHDMPARWAGKRVLVIGHVATRWSLDHFIDGVGLEDLIDADFGWREGWNYRLDDMHPERSQS